MRHSKEIENLLKDKTGFLKQNKFKLAAEVCNSIGRKLRQKGIYEEALKSHKEEKELSEMAGDNLDVAIAERNIGEVLFEMERFDEALDHHQKYNEKAAESGNRLEMARATYTLGRTFHQKSIYDSSLSSGDTSHILDKAEACFRKSLEILEVCRLRGEKDLETDSMKGRSVMNLGLISESRQDFESAVDHFKKALQIFLRYENSESKEVQEDLLRAFRNLAGANDKLGRQVEAINFAKKALVHAQKLHDAEEIIETNLLICSCQFRLGEYDSAKKLLRRCRSMAKESTVDPKILDVIERTLKKVIRIRRLQSSIEEGKELNPEEKSKKYEELADLFVSKEIASYRHGVDAYRSCLELRLQSGMTPKDIRLGPIYVSIADTYKDLGELEKVVEFYEKEIECHPDDEKETARSYLAIADAEADLGRDLKVVNDHYTFAYTRAVLAEKYPLAKHVLRCRLEYYRNKAPDQVSEIDRDYKDFCSTYDLDPDSYEDVDKESGESESRESQASCDIDCSDLSSDESDEDAASDDVGGPSAGRSLRTRRVAVAAVSKKDERGETPLHRAAREGNLKKIKTLVKGGADVNAYDNAGWTPLHEAALAGEIEIVDYLLRKGGDLTKTGVEVFKSVTEGMTPLHDAALGGHIDVMELMVKRGANMLAKTEKGETPLDCLRNWRISRERTGELDSQVLTEALEYERKLLEDMKKAGYKGSSRRSVDQVSSVVAEGEDFEVKTVPDDVIEYDSDNECNCGCAGGGPCIRLRTPQFASGKASEEYAEAMRSVGTSAKRSSSPRNEGRYLLSPIRQERKRTTSSSSSETVCERNIRPVKRVCADREVEKRGSAMEPMPDVIPVGRFNASSDVGFCRKKAVQPRINEVLGKVTATSFKNFGRRSSNEDLGSMRREYNLQFERSLTEPRFQPQDSTKTKFGRLNVMSPVVSSPSGPISGCLWSSEPR